MNDSKLNKAIELVDKLYSKDATGPQPATTKILHWWGQFSSELPPPFTLEGGHGWKEASSLSEADDLLEELRQSIFSQWPKTKEWAGKGWYRWMREDLKQMTLIFEDKLP